MDALEVLLSDNTIITCDWIQPNGLIVKLFLNTAGGNWLKETIPISSILSIPISSILSIQPNRNHA